MYKESLYMVVYTSSYLKHYAINKALDFIATLLPLLTSYWINNK